MQNWPARTGEAWAHVKYRSASANPDLNQICRNTHQLEFQVPVGRGREKSKFFIKGVVVKMLDERDAAEQKQLRKRGHHRCKASKPVLKLFGPKLEGVE